MELDSVNQKSIIAPVQKTGWELKANLTFRTFDWLLAEKIASHEFKADQLDEEHRRKLLLSIYPNQSTALHMIASMTT